MTDQERHPAQPEERHGEHSHRRADRRDGGGRLRQEHADQRCLPGAAPGRDCDRPVPRDGKQPLGSGHLHRDHGRHSAGVRQGQQGQRLALQLQLGGQLPQLQRPGRGVHRSGVHGGHRLHLRNLRGQTLQARGAGVPPARQDHQRRAGHDRGGSPGLLHREEDQGRAASDERRGAGLPEDWASRSAPCRAAKGSA